MAVAVGDVFSALESDGDGSAVGLLKGPRFGFNSPASGGSGTYPWAISVRIASSLISGWLTKLEAGFSGGPTK